MSFMTSWKALPSGVSTAPQLPELTVGCAMQRGYDMVHTCLHLQVGPSTRLFVSLPYEDWRRLTEKALSSTPFCVLRDVTLLMRATVQTSAQEEEHLWVHPRSLALWALPEDSSHHVLRAALEHTVLDHLCAARPLFQDILILHHPDFLSMLSEQALDLSPVTRLMPHPKGIRVTTTDKQRCWSDLNAWLEKVCTACAIPNHALVVESPTWLSHRHVPELYDEIEAWAHRYGATFLSRPGALAPLSIAPPLTCFQKEMSTDSILGWLVTQAPGFLGAWLKERSEEAPLSSSEKTAARQALLALPLQEEVAQHLRLLLSSHVLSDVTPHAVDSTAPQEPPTPEGGSDAVSLLEAWEHCYTALHQGLPLTVWPPLSPSTITVLERCWRFLAAPPSVSWWKRLTRSSTKRATAATRHKESFSSLRWHILNTLKTAPHPAYASLLFTKSMMPFMDAVAIARAVVRSATTFHHPDWRLLLDRLALTSLEDLTIDHRHHEALREVSAFLKTLRWFPQRQDLSAVLERWHQTLWEATPLPATSLEARVLYAHWSIWNALGLHDYLEEKHPLPLPFFKSPLPAAPQALCNRAHEAWETLCPTPDTLPPRPWRELAWRLMATSTADMRCAPFIQGLMDEGCGTGWRATPLYDAILLFQAANTPSFLQNNESETSRALVRMTEVCSALPSYTRHQRLRYADEIVSTLSAALLVLNLDSHMQQVWRGLSSAARTALLTHPVRLRARQAFTQDECRSLLPWVMVEKV